MGAKALKKPRKHEDALDQGFCTASRCRQFVLNGSGNQVYDEKKSKLDRFCWRCYREWINQETGGK